MEELCAPDYFWHSAPPGTPPGLAGARQVFTALWTAFPDAHVVVEDVIAEGDRVVRRWTMRGTHQGEFTDPAADPLHPWLRRHYDAAGPGALGLRDPQRPRGRAAVHAYPR